MTENGAAPSQTTRTTKRQTDPRSRHLAIWTARMELRGRKFAKAAELIGIDDDSANSTVTRINAGKRELTRTERLAMTAVRAGLEPWTPEYDDVLMKELEACRKANGS